MLALRRSWLLRGLERPLSRVALLPVQLQRRAGVAEKARTMSLHERIAAALGWTVREAEGFSLATLRELVPEKLKREISRRIVTGLIVEEPT